MSQHYQIRDYEDRCSLLSPAALEMLRRRWEEREKTLSGAIELGDIRVREVNQEQEPPTDRQQIVGVAANLAAEGVRGFADGLLLS